MRPFGFFRGGKRVGAVYRRRRGYLRQRSVSRLFCGSQCFRWCGSRANYGERNAEAEALRRGLFNPESFYRTPQTSERVHLYEARDAEEELEFVAASIKKHVLDGKERYAKISVMLPDIDVSERLLSRVFKRYRIPYYADRQLSLSEHSLCDFIINYILCVISGCRPCDVDGVIASPFFPAEKADKDVFRNYALRLAAFRGGVKRAPKRDLRRAGLRYRGGGKGKKNLFKRACVFDRKRR